MRCVTLRLTLSHNHPNIVVNNVLGNNFIMFFNINMEWIVNFSSESKCWNSYLVKFHCIELYAIWNYIINDFLPLTIIHNVKKKNFFRNRKKSSTKSFQIFLYKLFEKSMYRKSLYVNNVFFCYLRKYLQHDLSLKISLINKIPKRK